MHIDLNADLGETTAGNPVADDAAMLEMVSSANVATGFHAGDPHSIAGTLKNAAAHGVTLGAHVAYNCLLYTSPSPRDVEESRMPSSA